MKYKRLSSQKFNKILRCFCTDITAIACTEIVGVKCNTVNSWYNDFRHKIMLQVLAETRTESGEFEVDESYFGARRVRGKCGRGAAGKTPVFGLLKRGGKVIVRIVPDCSKESLMPIIQGLVLKGSTIHSDGWNSYDGLILNGYDHNRVFHSENEFARGKCHVNGIENFWSFLKRWLAKFNGCDSDKS